MRTADVVRIARQRAGLTQQQLAGRSGHPRETIARWETGAREPSLSDLRALVAAANLDLVINLAEPDESLLEAVDEALELTPIQRLRRAFPDGDWKDARRGLRWLSRARTATIVIGGIGDVLQGAPHRPPSGRVEFVSADPFATEREMADAPKRAALALASNVAGTGDFRDLRRGAEGVQLDKNTAVTVAHPRDLLRMADASPGEPERARIPGLRALLDRTTDR